MGRCELCDFIPGVLTGANGPHDLEACDECRTYGSDLVAAYAVARLVGGEVRFWQHDAEREAYREHLAAEGTFDVDLAEIGFELRTFDGTGRVDDCVLFGTYPWVDIDGDAVNWGHFWRMTFALRPTG